MTGTKNTERTQGIVRPADNRIGKGRGLENVFVERLWRTVMYAEVYVSLVDAHVQLDTYFRF